MKLKVEKIQKGLESSKSPRISPKYDGRIAEVFQLFGYYFAKQSIEVPYFPPVIWIEPTSNCNLRCSMCLTGKGTVKRVSAGMMDKTLYQEILTQLNDKLIIRTALFFRGEPLLHPEIVEMVALASRCNLKPYFHTNGTLMTKTLAEGLIKAGLNYISFSFDGDTKEEYETFRTGGNFDVTLSNILSFLKVKERLKSELPYVVIQKIDFNGKGVGKDHKKIFKNLPINQIKTTPPHNWAGEIRGISVKGAKNLPVYPCPDPWQRLTICWDGTVVACCNDMLQKYILGDMMRDNIEAIWNNQKIKELRYLMSTGQNRDIPLCKNCSFLYVNNWLI